MNRSVRNIALASTLSASLFAGVGTAAIASAPSKGKSHRTTYTAAQVATHNTATDCWTSINGKVYNLTRYIAKHPGGSAAITSLCGTDGTAAFTDKHGSSRSPARKLKRYRIGTLATGSTPAPAPSTSTSTKPADDDDCKSASPRAHDDDDRSASPAASQSRHSDDD